MSFLDEVTSKAVPGADGGFALTLQGSIDERMRLVVIARKADEEIRRLHLENGRLRMDFEMPPKLEEGTRLRIYGATITARTLADWHDLVRILDEGLGEAGEVSECTVCIEDDDPHAALEPKIVIKWDDEKPPPSVK